MKLSSWGQFFSYLGVGIAAIGLGVAVSTQFMGRVRSQETLEPINTAAEPVAPVEPAEQEGDGVTPLPPEPGDPVKNPAAPPAPASMGMGPGSAASPAGGAVPGADPKALDLDASSADKSAASSQNSPDNNAVKEDAPVELEGEASNMTNQAGAKAPQAQVGDDREDLLEGFMDPFEYDPSGKKDPFVPLEADRPAEAGALEGPFQPLQRFDLDQLNLVGIIWNVNSPKAMIADPGGNIHIVRENTRVGRNNGYVAAIREGEVVVVEPYVEDGRMTYSTRLLRINR